MSLKTNKIIYYIATGLLTALMLMSSGMYFLNYEGVVQIFASLGFPSFIIYPLAVVKILGLIAIWTKKSETLKEWAYAGFFFDFVMALSAHLVAKDGGHMLATIAIILLAISYMYDRKLFKAD